MTHWSNCNCFVERDRQILLTKVNYWVSNNVRIGIKVSVIVNRTIKMIVVITLLLIILMVIIIIVIIIIIILMMIIINDDDNNNNKNDNNNKNINLKWTLKVFL